MISHLRGKLIEKKPTEAIVECNGVGYKLFISLNTYSQIPDNENIFIHTLLLIREDAQLLYGFAQAAERAIFQLLISVSGVGASIALSMLSSLKPAEIRNAIIAQDVASIQAVKGIGAKTAQRLILDLRDKVMKIYEIDEIPAIVSNTSKDEALSALEVLGVNKKQSEKLIDNILKNTPDMPVETIIKEALKNL